MGSLFDANRPAMTEEEFRLLRGVVYEHCGILIREELRFSMERRLRARLESLGLNTFAGYYRFLRYDERRGEELERAVELLSTNETYFFREPTQLLSFRDEVLPELARRNQHSRRLRLWSAGCSSGEEAYGLAMLVLDSGHFAGWDVRIHGTDISRRVLDTARRAEYGPSAVRELPAEWLERYFIAAPRQHLRVVDSVQELVCFEQLNLLDAQRGQMLPNMDAVFCRNVMIYFDLPVRRRVLQLLHTQLVEGGYLLLGHAENLFSISTDFELVPLKNDLVYRRPLLSSGAQG